MRTSSQQQAKSRAEHPKQLSNLCAHLLIYCKFTLAKIFQEFNFRCLLHQQKYFNTELFPIYDITFSFPPFLSSLTPGGSMVKLKKIAQFCLLRGSFRNLDMAFSGVKASLTEIVRLAGLYASCC